MSDDLIKRLWALDMHPESAPRQAADEIERLRAENERLRASLSAITATDCYSRDECTAIARAALETQETPQ